MKASNIMFMDTRYDKVPELPVLPGSEDRNFKKLQPLLLLLFLFSLWVLAPIFISSIDETAGNIDQSVWLLIVLSLISFMLVAGLCWWLLQRFWLTASLPSLSTMVSRFNTLSIWQQLTFYWASFALLLLAASICLNAIC